MKGRKLLALALVLALSLSLGVPALAADTKTHADFPDLTPNWSWAYPVLDDALQRGLFIGYDDGRFHPADPITYATGLTLCGRILVSADTRAQILADREAEVKTLIPDKYSWFRREAATCLELGVLSPFELSSIVEEDKLGEPMEKEIFAIYLIRAVGLEDLAAVMDQEDQIDTPFADASTIAADAVPYVSLLHQYGVLTGDEKGNFNPHSELNRVICATMLSRAITNIAEARSVKVELPRYTKYSWTSGTVQGVDVDSSGKVLRLKTPFEGEKSIPLDADTRYFQYNMKSQSTVLKEGACAKVCYASDGETVSEVRVIPAALLRTLSGPCDGVTTDTLTVQGETFSLDRFTQVKAGGKAGTCSLIDPEAQYTRASLTVDNRGRVLWTELTGGTRQLEGVLTAVATNSSGAAEKTSVTVTAYNGLATTYPLTSAVEITAGSSDKLLESYVGRQVILRVADDDPADLKRITVNMNDQFVQGVLRSVDAKAGKVEITLTGAAKRTPYELSEEAVVEYGGAAVELARVPVSSMVTAKVEGGMITLLSAWQGYEDTEGTLTEISYGDTNTPITLKVTRTTGEVAEFAIPRDRLPNVAITASGKDSDITGLKAGDKVTVTLRHNEVTQIDYVPQDANITGTLTALSFGDNTILTLKLSTGETESFTAAANFTVTRSGVSAGANSLSSNDIGKDVALLVQRGVVVSMEISGSAALSRESVSGTILALDPTGRTATVQISADQLVRVHFPSSFTIVDKNTGASLDRVSKLSVNDVVELYGNYGSDGVFEITTGIRK